MVILTHEFDVNNEVQVDQQDVTKCLVCWKPIHHGSEDFPFANRSVLVFCVNFDLNKYGRTQTKFMWDVQKQLSGVE